MQLLFKDTVIEFQEQLFSIASTNSACFSNVAAKFLLLSMHQTFLNVTAKLGHTSPRLQLLPIVGVVNLLHTICENLCPEKTLPSKETYYRC